MCAVLNIVTKWEAIWHRMHIEGYKILLRYNNCFLHLPIALWIDGESHNQEIVWVLNRS